MFKNEIKEYNNISFLDLIQNTEDSFETAVQMTHDTHIYITI